MELRCACIPIIHASIRPISTPLIQHRTEPPSGSLQSATDQTQPATDTHRYTQTRRDEVWTGTYSFHTDSAGTLNCIFINQSIGGFYQRQGEALPPQKFGQSRNMLHKGVDFYVQNALKLTYEHLQFQKFSRGRHPRTPANI